jgi:high-affinity Fe2+/Pb2+ permease
MRNLSVNATRPWTMVAGVLVSVTVTLMVTRLASATGLGEIRTVVRVTSGFWR